MSHWYDLDGNPHHFYETKKGESKPTTLRQARPKNWFPSVTTVIQDTLRSQMLEKWFQKQAVKATLNASRQFNEDEEAFVSRVIHESLQKSRDATDFGTEVHHHLEQYNLDQTYTVPESAPFYEMMVDILEHYKDWFAENVVEIVSAEERVACKELGLAGTIDRVYIRKGVGLTIGDTKTQGVNPKYGPTFYENFPIQLSLYSRMYRLRHRLDADPRIQSEIVNSEKADPIAEKLYTPEEQQTALALGLSLTRAWFLRKNYFPYGLDVYNPDVWLS
jgi:hypothetical protein